MVKKIETPTTTPYFDRHFFLNHKTFNLKTNAFLKASKVNKNWEAKVVVYVMPVRLSVKTRQCSCILSSDKHTKQRDLKLYCDRTGGLDVFLPFCHGFNKSELEQITSTVKEEISVGNLIS